ncbi:LytTR family DNA-binding domain-containing protein [Spirosoma utsteinense]|uniref:DNA-binding LytR/AlgR family response regulator n=1 Tax=Spirosoma utsteinense TaxID=2585773 RepID=A0ABR6W141_9BACT|nr:LytTR family DNA-binding domain-containing protein [Spirosoma utsteinense]MBC3785064.1 DNA-binding LytR/AlgR family response regulator [Spirosoma utsteinense]MBC3790327.1 DNA-binding LytR/AlgR family response regulator [Spirosoma utsteinense]
MFRLLSQPYPTEESIRRLLIKAVTIGLFVGLFLLIFQPFGLDDWQTSAKVSKIMGFGLVTMLVMIADSLFLPALFPRYFSDQHWTVGREIVRVLLLLIVIAAGNRFYLAWLFDAPSSGYGWLSIMGMTFVVGIFPTIGAVLLNYIVQLRKYSRMAAEIPDHSDASAPREPWLSEQVSAVRTHNAVESTLNLVADNEKDTLTLGVDKLLFIESSDNYCTVVYLASHVNGTEQTLKPLLRTSLSRLETQIAGRQGLHSHLVRCHRSYIVNLNRVERVTGNAQGYKLHLSGGKFQVPVARRFNDTLIGQLKSLL